MKAIFTHCEGLLLSQVPSHGTCVEVDLKKNSAAVVFALRKKTGSQQAPGRRHLISAAKFFFFFSLLFTLPLLLRLDFYEGLTRVL